MAIARLPCFNYQAMTAGKEKDFGLTPAEIRPIWDYAKKRYLDNGVSYEETIDALSRETGAPHRFFEEVFVGPKSRRVKTLDILRKEEARRAAKASAEEAIAAARYPYIARKAYQIGQIPRAALTAFHGGVFPVTHAGGLLLSPSKWGIFLRGERVAWGALSKADYEAQRLKLFSEPSLPEWKAAGIRVGFGERPQGILAGLVKRGKWGDRAWLALERMRFDVAEQSLKRFKWNTPEEKLAIMKGLAEVANHATGVSNLPFLGIANRLLFAPQLTSSKFYRATVDPVKTAGTVITHPVETVRVMANMLMGRGSEVSAPQRAAAYTRLRNAVEYISTMIAGLYLNDQILQMAGSDQRINFTDPHKSDWLRFKTGLGSVLTSRGPEDFLRLYGDLGWIAAAAAERRTIHGRNPWDEIKDKMSDFALYKISPGVGTTGEFALGTDIYGRPLPPEFQKIRTAATFGLLQEPQAQRGKEQLSLAQYVQSHAPIFWAGGSREFYNDLKERGLSEADQRTWLLAALSTAMEFAGFGSSPEPHEPVMPTKKGKQKPVQRAP